MITFAVSQAVGDGMKLSSSPQTKKALKSTTNN